VGYPEAMRRSSRKAVRGHHCLRCVWVGVGVFRGHGCRLTDKMVFVVDLRCAAPSGAQLGNVGSVGFNVIAHARLPGECPPRPSSRTHVPCFL
jgi:hypothetical protein